MQTVDPSSLAFLEFPNRDYQNFRSNFQPKEFNSKYVYRALRNQDSGVAQ